MQRKIITTAAKRPKMMVSHVLQAKNDIPTLSQLNNLLEPKMSAALTNMSRIEPKNRRLNEDFSVMLKHKLRLSLWPGERLRCTWETIVDA